MEDDTLSYVISKNLGRWKTFFLFVFAQKKSLELQKNCRRGKIFHIVLSLHLPTFDNPALCSCSQEMGKDEAWGQLCREGRRRARLMLTLSQPPILHLMVITCSRNKIFAEPNIPSHAPCISAWWLYEYQCSLMKIATVPHPCPGPQGKLAVRSPEWCWQPKGQEGLCAPDLWAAPWAGSMV